MFSRQVLQDDLGCASYVIADGGQAAVIDSKWEIEDYVGDVARPDLAVEPDEGARDLFHSLRSLDRLDDYAEVWPGHIGGSLCGGAGMSETPGSTLGFERRFNRFLEIDEPDEFVRALTAEPAPQPPTCHRFRVGSSPQTSAGLPRGGETQGGLDSTDERPSRSRAHQCLLRLRGQAATGDGAPRRVADPLRRQGHRACPSRPRARGSTGPVAWLGSLARSQDPGRAGGQRSRALRCARNE